MDFFKNISSKIFRGIIFLKDQILKKLFDLSYKINLPKLSAILLCLLTKKLNGKKKYRVLCLGRSQFNDDIRTIINFGHSIQYLFFHKLLLGKIVRYMIPFSFDPFVIPGYFYGRLLVDIKVRHLHERYIILAIGIAIGFASSLFDIIGIFRGKPLIPWLRSPHLVGIFIASVTFAYSFLSRYTWVFSTLTRSQNEIERLMAKSNRDFMEFVQLIAKTLDAKDKYTAGHSLRVMDYAGKIARALQIPEKEIDLLKQACLLHDIGKISIPDGILNKKKKLTKREREYIFNHPVVGKKILSTVSDFKEILDIIYAHHERIDGSGYPDGRMHDDIPFLARILAVADTYDAMRSERPYRPASPLCNSSSSHNWMSKYLESG